MMEKRHFELSSATALIHMFKYLFVFTGMVYTNLKEIEFNWILNLRLLLSVCETVIPGV